MLHSAQCILTKTGSSVPLVPFRIDCYALLLILVLVYYFSFQTSPMLTVYHKLLLHCFLTHADRV